MRTLLSALASVLWVASSAQAADVPVTKAPPLATAVHNWAGFYLGINAGAAFSRAGTDEFSGPVFPAYLVPPPPVLIAVPGLPGTIAATGGRDTTFIGGGQVGYNWQLNRIVFGVEADVDASRIRTSATAVGVPAGGATRPQTVTTSYLTEADWMASIRGRFGYAIERTMVYATAGAAFTRVTVNAMTTLVNDPAIVTPGTFTATGSQSQTRIGATFGAGFQWAMTESWSVGGEFRHTSFGKQDLANIIQIPDAFGGALSGASTSVKLSSRQVTVRLNWRLP